MALPANTAGGMFNANDLDRPGAHVAGDAIFSHLQAMGNRGRRSRQGRSTQPRRGRTGPVIFNKEPGRGDADMALHAGGQFRVGCYRGVFS